MGFGLLTAHQQKIVRMMAKGMSSEQIADEIGVTVWTVNFHRKNIRKALGVKSDMEMHRYAILVGMAEETSPGSQPS
jgi:DNA-binding NarL/FixJ family response regulator